MLFINKGHPIILTSHFTYRGYNTAAQRYEFYFWVVEKILIFYDQAQWVTKY